MGTVIEVADNYLYYIVELCTIIMELFGVIILVFTAIKSFIEWFKKDENIRLHLAQGIALALEFKLGGEVLRTVVVREWSELGILGAIILLRGVLTFLIHWEIKNEKNEIAQNEK
ncbi:MULTISPECIES: DUF1622 domain-containing protein [Butyrivibrio]|jgi:uncharacterized membrane protein|uniref:DUF1622 domain-containing protein n=1 Tax=Butyrivibrio TaxID=830 RepID=UPI0003B3C2F8|nr:MULTISPECIES: DUF1622 domain-containing protein [Butyrivibrio]MCR5770635.1 DUF1622 domain-containing protein [Butyrivibrio sp.]